MKIYRMLSVCLLMMVISVGLQMAVFADAFQDEIFSQAYVVMDAKTGQVILEKEKDAKHYPASITKIMTAALALENKKLDDTITMSKEAVDLEYGSAHIALSPDERLPLRDALYATMLMSANDAANGIAEMVGGSMENFAQMMTEKAKSLGAKNTNFINANGLYDENHYSTAYDMALITKYALTVDGFREFFGAKIYEMQPTNIQPKERYFSTYHSMLKKSNHYYYPEVTGGKLGYTHESGYTIVTVAEKNGIELIVVCMESQIPSERYTDTKALLDYAFENYEYLTLSSMDKINGYFPRQITYNENTYFGVANLDSISFLVPTGVKESDLELKTNITETGKPNEVVSQLDFCYNGEPIYSLKVNYSLTSTADNKISQAGHSDRNQNQLDSSIILAPQSWVLYIGTIILVAYIYVRNYQHTSRQAASKR